MDTRKKITAVGLALVLCGASCGRLGTIEHEGTIDAKVSIDEAQLRRYFSNYCARQLKSESGTEPIQAEIDACTDDWVADFLAAVTSKIDTTPTPVH